MKIYSWNVCSVNTKPQDAKNFIENLEFDILCLQEVTTELLEYLKTLPYHIAYHQDRTRILPAQASPTDYHVILSKCKILKTYTMSFPDLPFPLRTRLFIAVLNLFRHARVEERGALYADLETERGVLRVASAHLTLWSPSFRVREFERLVDALGSEYPRIIAGDFNILEWPPIKTVSWFFGASLKESMPWYPERRLFEERFKRHHLVNPLRGKRTQRTAFSQLDHILVDERIHTVSSWVERNAHGSDHKPVGVEVSI